MPSLPTTIFGAGAALWAVLLFTLAPFLLSDRVRTLLESGPSDLPPVNYLLGTFALAIGHVASMVAVTMAFGPFRDLDVIFWLGVVTVAYPILAFGALSIALARTGRSTILDDWSGRSLLVGGAIWYAVATSIAQAVVLFLVVIFSLPGGW